MHVSYEPNTQSPYHTEIRTLDDFEKLMKLNLAPVNILIIYGETTTQENIEKAKKILGTKEFRVTSNHFSNEILKERLINLVTQKINVILSVVFKNYKNKVNLQALIFNEYY